MDLQLTEMEQALLALLLEMPPKYEEAKSTIQQTAMTAESITKVGIRYTAECEFEFGDWIAENQEGVCIGEEEFPSCVVPGLHSTYIYEVVKFLLEHGLEPNAVFDSTCSRRNIMDELLFVDHEYLAADTMALLLEHGGDPNLIVDGESVFEQVDFEVWFGSIEQYVRWRYDAWVHIWMVLVAYGGELRGKGPMVKVFKEYGVDDMFELRKLRNHRDFYSGLSIENNERKLHVYDKKTLWKVAEW